MIDNMRTYFDRPGHAPVDTVTFAQGVFDNVKRAIRDQVNRIGFAPASSVALLDVVLGDPAKPDVEAVLGYVNNGEWKAKCECGGCEFVDLVLALYMCCSCWNAAHGRRWRPVTLPTLIDRTAIEAALVLRPDRTTRNWKPGEAIPNLLAENVAAGL